MLFVNGENSLSPETFSLNKNSFNPSLEDYLQFGIWYAIW